MSSASKELERITQTIFQRLREQFGFERVEGSRYYQARDSGVKRQVDNTAYALDKKKIIIECKLHNRPINIKYIDAFYTLIHVDVGADGGIMVSNRGFTRGAIRSAQAKQITLATLNKDVTEHHFLLGINDRFYGWITVPCSVALI